MSSGYKVAIIGATGLVGRTVLKVLEERNFPVSELKLFSSDRSAGEELEFKDEKLKLRKLDEYSFQGIDIALFSAGSGVSLKYAPFSAKSNCLAIDNSSAWRMDVDTPLVVPEVNPDSAKKHKYIIANPNCSTIQMVLPLKVIEDNFGLQRVIVSTYQSISGAGQKGIYLLENDLKTGKREIAYNIMFHPFEDNGWTVEENKMRNETRKIMSMPELKISVTCVRLPILGGHGESINFETKTQLNIKNLKSKLNSFPGIVYCENDNYPHPAMSENLDEVFVSRLRVDDSVSNAGMMWVVADNLRKGAATNAVQIAELIAEKGWV